MTYATEQQTSVSELQATIAALRQEVADLRSGAIHKREGKCIVIKWDIDDVKDVRGDLDDAQAFHVLSVIKDNHDANYGVCLQTISDTAENLYPED